MHVGRDVSVTERLEKVDVNKLIPYARNARTHNKEQILQLRSSLREFGFINPVLIDRDYNIIAGHGRVMAAKAEEMTEIPCVYVEHLSEAQKKAYILADNRIALNADWDEEMLALELEGLKELQFDIELTGFDTAEMEKLLSDMNTPEGSTAQEDDFDIEQVEADITDPISHLGDIWLLGKHRLMCGDSTNSADVKLLMDGKKARCVFTDPPWNVNYGADAKHPSWKSRQILNDKMTADEFGDFLLSAFKCMTAASEPGCMTYVVMSAQEWGNIMNVMNQAGYHWSSTIIWKKDSLVLSRKDYHTQYEPIWYGWLEEKRLYPLEDRKQSDVWDIPRPKVSVEHPTMKPIALVAKALQNSSRTDDVVLDLFGGSGSTLIAAHQTSRICHTMELDPKYCDVIVQRYIGLLGSHEGIYLLRDGEQTPYDAVGKNE